VRPSWGVASDGRASVLRDVRPEVRDLSRTRRSRKHPVPGSPDGYVLVWADDVNGARELAFEALGRETVAFVYHSDDLRFDLHPRGPLMVLGIPPRPFAVDGGRSVCVLCGRGSIEGVYGGELLWDRALDGDVHHGCLDRVTREPADGWPRRLRDDYHRLRDLAVKPDERRGNHGRVLGIHPVGSGSPGVEERPLPPELREKAQEAAICLAGAALVQAGMSIDAVERKFTEQDYTIKLTYRGSDDTFGIEIEWDDDETTEAFVAIASDQ
jgi:hypothetical protein